MAHFRSSLHAVNPCAAFAQVWAYALVAAAFTVGVPEPGLAQGTLSIEMAVNAASERSLHIGAHEASAASAREMAVVARQLPDPMLRMSLDNTPVEGASQWSLRQDSMTMQSVGLMQTFVSSEKRNALSDRYEQEARLADAERAVELAALQRSAAEAWLERYYLERNIELLRQQRAEAAVIVDTTEAIYRSGQVQQSDVFTAHADAVLLDDQISEAEIELSNASAALERWIGESANLPLADLPAWTEDDLEIPDSQAQLTWLAQQEELALSETRVARTNRRPDWNVELMYGKRGPAFEDMVSLGVSVPLQWRRKNKQDRELAASLAELERVQRRRTEQLRDYELQIQEWQNAWDGNLRRLSSYDATLLPLAQERAEVALSAYRGNTASLEEVLQSRQAQIELLLERNELERQTAHLWAQLRFLAPIDSGSQQNISASGSAQGQ